jgi:hypothetical protein
MEASGRAGAFQEETPDAVAGHAGQRIVEALQGEADKLDELFYRAVAGSIAPEQALTMPAEGTQVRAQGAAVRPIKPVPFVVSLVVVSIPRMISAEQDRK